MTQAIPAPKPKTAFGESKLQHRRCRQPTNPLISFSRREEDPLRRTRTSRRRASRRNKGPQHTPDQTNPRPTQGWVVIYHTTHITILLTNSRNTPASLAVSSSDSVLTPLPATSSSRRTSSGLTTPSQTPIRRVTTELLTFSLACWTVRKYEPMVSGPLAPFVRPWEAFEAASTYFISPWATRTYNRRTSSCLGVNVDCSTNDSGRLKSHPRFTGLY